MKTSNLIFNTIENEIIKSRGFNCFLSRKYIIVDLIKRLKPDLPEDQTSGFIAYNVPNKDRMKMKTTRFLTRKLSLNSGFLPDKLISDISNQINNELFGNDGIEIRLDKGSQITRNYRDEIGGYSCMTGSCSDYTKLYENNPDRFSQLVMIYQNDSARAIVSKLDNGKYYMDRVYSTSEYLKSKMYKYADNHEWSNYKNDKGEDLIISNLSYENGHIPYMDTFKNGCTCYSGLTISADGCCDYVLENTNGYLEEGYACDFCNEHMPEDGYYSAGADVLCEYCFNDNYGYCQNCDDATRNEDIVYISDIDEYYCRWCADSKAVYCEDCNKYILDYVCIENEKYVCLECADSTNYDRCEACEEYFYAGNLTQHQGCWYCSDCLPEDELEDEIKTITCKNYPGQMEINYSEKSYK